VAGHGLEGRQDKQLLKLGATVGRFDGGQHPSQEVGDFSFVRRSK